MALKWSKYWRSHKSPPPQFVKVGQHSNGFRPRLAYIGGTEGANAWVQTELENDLSVIVLSNFDPPSAEAVTMGILDWVKSQEIDR